MEIRRSYDRLISTMGFPILVRCHLYIESGPSMFVNGENLNTLETKFNTELKHVSTWLQVNKLSLKVDKSCFIVFRTVKKSDLEVNICINDKRLSRVSRVKFLETIIDDKLTWKPHIHYISEKLSKAIAICIG